MHTLEKKFYGGGHHLKSLGLNFTLFLTAKESGLPSSIDGVPVISVKDFAALTQKPAIVFVWSDVTVESSKFSEYFRKFGCQVLNFQFYGAAQQSFVDFVSHHFADIFEVYGWLDPDDGSREWFLASVLARTSSDQSLFRYADEPQYFYAPYLPQAGDIVIDAGSFDGMTAAEFASMGCKAYSFEMDAANFPTCEKNAEKYGFTVENMGLSSERTQSRYQSGGSGSSMVGRDGPRPINGMAPDASLMHEAKFTDLDSYVREKSLPRVDFIKMDIEGAELDALKGAAASIVKYKPHLAICVYHKNEDLWTIPRYIKSLRSDYRFSFRHYATNSVGYDADIARRMKMAEPYGLDRMLRNGSEMILYGK